MNFEDVKKIVAPVLKKYGVKAASVFGSVARGDAGPDSDVDMVVKVTQLKFGIWGFVALKQDLEQALSKKVDVISEDALNPKLMDKIKNDLKLIYEGA